MNPCINHWLTQFCPKSKVWQDPISSKAGPLPWQHLHCLHPLWKSQNKGGPENPKAKRQQTNESNTDNWFISFSPLASFFLEDEHYGRIHCKFHFFPTCQVRVVWFYQSCSPRLAVLLVLVLLLLLVLRLLLLLCLLLQFLLDHVCINFHLNFRLANSSPSSLPTSQLSVHRWTSTWDQTSSVCTAGPQPGDLPSSVCTAGPQPGTFPAQCAPLDLNLGPSQLSVHCWTSTAR